MAYSHLRLRLVCLTMLCLASPLQAQVDYQNKDSLWYWGRMRKSLVWFYNLGITGLGAQLIANHPKALLIKNVFPMSSAKGHVKVGDLIVGAGGMLFKERHRNGYGESVFSANRPISEIAQVLEERQGGDGKGMQSW